MLFCEEYDFLSNFYLTPVTYADRLYPSTENAYQAQKCPERAKEFENITPAKAKRLGRKVEVRSDWDEVKDRVMFDLIKIKFMNNPQLLNKLKEIKGPIIEHNYWHDNYWGDCTCPECQNIPGKNTLGHILEFWRDNL